MQEGCRKVTMDEIATYNCMSKRTLYENFRDKNDLVEQCVLYGNNLANSHYSEFMNCSDNVLDFLLEGYEGHQSSVMGNYISFLDEVKKYFPEIYRKTVDYIKKSHRDMLSLILKRGQDDGFIIKLIATEDMVMAMASIMKATVLLSSDKESVMSHQKIFKLLNVIYLRGLATDKGRAVIDEFLEKHKNDNN